MVNSVMMKKRWLLPLLISLLLLPCCSEQEKGGQEETGPKAVKVFKLKNSGWDIYEGENYRYGPSIIINDDGSIDAWFAQWVIFTASGTSCTIKPEKYGISGLGIRYRRPEIYSRCSILGRKGSKPQLARQPCGLTLKLFKWDDPSMSYADVVAQPAIATERYTNYADGEKLELQDRRSFRPEPIFGNCQRALPTNRAYGCVKERSPVSPATGMVLL